MPAYILEKKQVLEVLWGLIQSWEPFSEKEYKIKYKTLSGPLANEVL